MYKKALGRGLESLMPSLLASRVSIEEKIITISLDKIRSNRFQPRNKFDETKLQELAYSIKKHGLAQPILVSESIVPGEYEIIAGERRFRASKLAGNKDIKAIIKHSINDKQKFDLALIENIQRENLDPIEEAKAFKRLVDEFGHTHEQIAEIVGKDRPVVSNALRLLSLPEDIQLLISEGKISSGHGKILASINDENQIRIIVNKILNEKLSVRAVERIVSGISSNKKSYKWSKQKQEQEVELVDLKEEIQRKLGTKVNILGTTRKGKIEIYYYSLEDLERIIKELSVTC
ncbi:MAG: ParB/RepB/Spo0J family partition protein [Endomicrobium sp.]|jgi:ParB family chromosome partitioning protein|nr:ParB/RepB/Spo0J family partition protein [Endomicrobium sp.]